MILYTNTAISLLEKVVSVCPLAIVSKFGGLAARRELVPGRGCQASWEVGRCRPYQVGLGAILDWWGSVSRIVDRCSTLSLATSRTRALLFICLKSPT